MITCLGIARELTNSPGRESDDALILKAVLDQVEGLRIGTRLMTPEEADRSDLSGHQMVLPMCDAYPRLMRLRTLEGSPVVMVNPPMSGCYRTEMIRPRARAQLPHGTSAHPFHGNLPRAGLRLVPGCGSAGAPTHDHRDVVYADLAEAEAWRLDFERRGSST